MQTVHTLTEIKESLKSEMVCELKRNFSSFACNEIDKDTYVSNCRSIEKRYADKAMRILEETIKS